MDVFLWLIPVIDDLAPLSLCVGGLVNYSLILLSVYFIWVLNCFSMSNKYACACLHMWQNSMYKHTTHMGHMQKVVEEFVPSGFEMKHHNYWSLTRSNCYRVLGNTDAGKNSIDLDNDHKPLGAFQKHFSLTEIIKNGL